MVVAHWVKFWQFDSIDFCFFTYFCCHPKGSGKSIRSKLISFHVLFCFVLCSRCIILFTFFILHAQHPSYLTGWPFQHKTTTLEKSTLTLSSAEKEVSLCKYRRALILLFYLVLDTVPWYVSGLHLGCNGNFLLVKIYSFNWSTCVQEKHYSHIKALVVPVFHK